MQFSSIFPLQTSEQGKKFREVHCFDGSCFDIRETRLGTRRGCAVAKPVEQSAEGLRGAGEVVSGRSWSHMKGEDPRGCTRVLGV